MRKVTVILFVITIMMASCSSNEEKQNLSSEITKLEKKIADNSELIFKNPKVVSNLISLYDDYCTNYPEDSLAALYTYKAAELNNALGKGEDAIKYYKKILSNYPDFDKAPYCLFLIAFVYETQLNNIEEAKKYYSEFIDKYPDHEFADDAKISIENLGIDLEELVKKFEKSQSVDSLTNDSADSVN